MEKPTNGHKNGTNGHGTNGHGSNGHLANGHRSIRLATAPKDLLEIVFRQRHIAILAFAGILAAGIVFSLFLADRYEAQMLVLVEQGERADPVVTAQPNAAPIVNSNGITEQQMNSEVGLLRSRDLLRQVVIDCGLASKPPSRWDRFFPGSGSTMSEDERVSRAARQLGAKLQIEVVRMSDLISVSYKSNNPQLAANVLKTLGALYLKKHAAVHQPTGAFAFFQHETDRYRQALQQAEARLIQFTRKEGVVSASQQTSATLSSLNDFLSIQHQTQASIAETKQRIQALQEQAKALPARMTTAVQTNDNAMLLQQLNSTLLTLELQRTQLLEKYQPTYRAVQEVDKQVAETRTAIANAEKDQWRAVTTDRDPNFELTREEMTKARADLAGFEARAEAISQAIHAYQANAQRLQQAGVVQQDLERNAQIAGDNYLLYVRKEEEARVSEALNSHQILNVAIAEAPTVPSLPDHSDLWYAVVSGIVAGFGAIGLAFVSDNLDPTIRTPEEAESALDVPLLIALPKKGNERVHVS